MGTDEDTHDEGETSPTDRTREELHRTKERLGEGADKAVKGFDESVVDLL